MNIRINIDQSQLNEVRRRLDEVEGKAPKAILASLNRAVTSVKASISKEVRKNYVIKASDVKETITKDINKGNLSAIVRSKGSPVPLDRFRISPKEPQPARKKPIKIAVKKAGLKKSLGSFVVDLHGNKVFKRTGRFTVPTHGAYAGKTRKDGTPYKREMIDRKFGPSIPQMIGKREVAEQIQKDAQETFKKRLDHEIDRILNRSAGGT